MPEAGFESLRQRVAEAKAPVIFSGAGLSAASGVPTFRGRSDHALWSRYDPLELASIDGFTRDPGLVLAWYAWRRGLVGAARPNAAHQALSGFERAILVTQNVDDLQERAGTDPERVLHLHGSIAHDRCHAGCGWSEGVDMLDPPVTERKCPECGGAVRPAVVWFGEGLPQETWGRAHQACARADLLLVVGTSGMVQPAATLVDIAAGAGAFVVNINPEPTALDGISDVCIREPATEILPRLLA